MCSSDLLKQFYRQSKYYSTTYEDPFPSGWDRHAWLVCFKDLSDQLNKKVCETQDMLDITGPLLDSRISMLVDENLEIRRTEYLDITQFDIAARINLTDLQVNANSNRYLTFIKGRVGRKISDFFMDFLGAAERLSSATYVSGIS